MSNDFAPMNELISDIRVFMLDGSGTTRAFVTVEIAQQFAIKNIRVVEGQKGLFVSFPQEKGRDGSYYDVCNTITAEARALFSSAVLEAYESAQEDSQPEPKPATNNRNSRTANGSSGSRTGSGTAAKGKSTPAGSGGRGASGGRR